MITATELLNGPSTALWSFVTLNWSWFIHLVAAGRCHRDGQVHRCGYIQRSCGCLYTRSPRLRAFGWFPSERFPCNGWKSRCKNSATQSKYVVVWILWLLQPQLTKIRFDLDEIHSFTVLLWAEKTAPTLMTVHRIWSISQDTGRLCPSLQN